MSGLRFHRLVAPPIPGRSRRTRRGLSASGARGPRPGRQDHDTHHPISNALYYEEQRPTAKRYTKEFWRHRIPKMLGYFEKVLEGSRGPYVFGRKVSYVDLSLFQIVEGLRYAFPRRMVSSSIGSFRPGLEAHKIRLLLTATKNRLPYLPDLPTSAEVGLPGYLMSVWICVVAPAGTPAPMLARIHALTESMQKDATARKAMEGAGLDVVTMSQPEFAAFVKTEYARWEKIVKDAGVEKM